MIILYSKAFTVNKLNEKKVKKVPSHFKKQMILQFFTTTFVIMSISCCAELRKC